MSGSVAHAELLRQARELLAHLLADGVEAVRAAPPVARARRVPKAPSTPKAASPAKPASPASVPAPARRAESGALVPPLVFERPPSGPRADALDAIRADLGQDCRRCRLCEQRQTIVFGEGSPDAPVVFVGEGPGADEDRTGRPFVGRAGELLTRIIASVGWRREDVYICNIVKCRPPGNRDPQPDEVAACLPFLERQLRAIAPRVIVALGKPAAQTLLGRPLAITKVRGIWQEWQGIPLMPTYHPAYLLRNYTRETRQAVWDDLRAVRARVDEAASRDA